MKKTKDIAEEFIQKFKRKEVINGTIEIINASFLADREFIFGTPDFDYIKREIEWYDSMSLDVNTIPGSTPKIWRQVASESGKINSNYGYLIYSKENGFQYKNVLAELISNSDTRRATMIYQRPSMHSDFCVNGMSDFICTNTVNYFIRNGQLVTCVYMRSNDVVFGYRNDYAWQNLVRNRLLADYNKESSTKISMGPIYWNVASLHIYKRHFYLVEKYQTTFDYE